MFAFWKQIKPKQVRLMITWGQLYSLSNTNLISILLCLVETIWETGEVEGAPTLQAHYLRKLNAFRLALRNRERVTRGECTLPEGAEFTRSRIAPNGPERAIFLYRLLAATSGVLRCLYFFSKYVALWDSPETLSSGVCSFPLVLLKDLLRQFPCGR